MSDKFKVIEDVEIKPKHDFVCVRSDHENDLEMTTGGVIIPREVQTNKKTQTGTIVAVGPGRYGGDGKRVRMQSEVGQRVLFAQFIGYPLDVNSERFYMIKDYDIMAIVEEKAEYYDEMPTPDRRVLD
ncbi:MAG: co-chaperone GroES [Gammaproteobacteria bacterium]|nr:co-chaperone GroES [Gammaproteobacteria bacterium]